MSLTLHEVCDRQVAANQANAQKSTGWKRKSEPAKPECNLESTTCRIADVVGRPIAKFDEAGTGPKGRNERPKPECNLESMTSRIAHVVGRPIAKAGEPSSADLVCKSAALRVKKCNPPGNLEAETPRYLCYVLGYAAIATGVTRHKELTASLQIRCCVQPSRLLCAPDKRIRDLRLGISALGLFWARTKGSWPQKTAKTGEQTNYLMWNQLLNLKNKPKTKPNQSH